MTQTIQLKRSESFLWVEKDLSINVLNHAEKIDSPERNLFPYSGSFCPSQNKWLHDAARKLLINSLLHDVIEIK